MKKIISCFLFLTFLSGAVFAQKKPELPSDFFESFSYTLPAKFDFKDSLQLSGEMNKIAGEIDKKLQDAASNYSIADSTELYYFLRDVVLVQTFFNRSILASETIISLRKLRPAPAYRAPFGLQELAYNRAVALHKDDGSNEFKQVLSETFSKELSETTDPDFRNDIVNQQKGNYNIAAISVYFDGLRKIIEQARQRSENKLDYNNASSLLLGYENYLLRKNYQPIIENVLFKISPARVDESNVKIPMKDGVKLNAFVYRDVADSAKQPAIISLSPYPSGTEAMKGNVFATNGYVYVYVDTRGRRESEGTFMPYEDDARDYYDIIDWVSKQSWCNGKVATSGGSYVGFDQWQAIRKKYKHPALKAINPMVSVGFGIDFPRNAGQFYPYILQWANFVSGKELNEPVFNDYKFWNEKNYELYKKRIPFARLDSVAGLPNPIFQKWVSHPDFDHYWQDILPAKEDYATLDIPVLSITGYYDADQSGALYYYNQHQKYGNAAALKEHYLLIGPYEHGAAQWQPNVLQAGMELEKEAQIPIYKYVIWWFDWKLKDKQKPAFIKDKITYFETGSHAWKGTPSFKALTTDSLQLYLVPSIVPNKKRKELYSLSRQAPAGTASMKYRHDISMAIDSAFLFAQPKPFSDSLYLVSPYNLVFESAPLEKDIIISDKILARIYVMLNVPDADFEISIQEVTPDGKDKNLAFGNVRARYRNGEVTGQLVKPGEIAELNFDNIYVYIKRIGKGSKLRLQFQSSNSPYAEKNYGFGGVVSQESTTKPRIIEATIQVNKKYPSKIVIPITNK
jgi:putative CocE/NonD family hydrolase